VPGVTIFHAASVVGTSRLPSRPQCLSNLAVLSETSGSASRDQAISIAQGHGGVPVGVGPGRSAMRSILLAMMKSFSCNPLILVLRETVAQRGGRRRKGGIRAAARAFGLTRHRLGPHHRGLYNGCSGEHTYCSHSTRGSMAPFKP
jgi:hypothetical protein